MTGNFAKFLFLASGIFVLAGCVDGPDISAEAERATKASTDTLEARDEIATRPLVAEHHDKPYLDTKRIAYAGVPWLNEEVHFRAAELPLDISLKKALEQLSDPPSVVFMPDLTERDIPVTLNHHAGTFADFLNILAEASGYGWEQKGGALYWSKEITRSLEIHRVPGDFDFSMETVEGDDEAVETGGGGTGTEVTGTPEAGGSISLEGGGEFWGDLEDALSDIMTDGTVTTDRGRGTVILRGPASMVREAEKYVDALNHWLSRQVLLEVQLVNVTLTGQRNVGIDWTLVQEATTSSLVAASTGNFAGQLAGSSLSFQLSEDGSSSIFRGSQVVIQALEDQGTTSVQTSPRIVALNGQAAQLQVLDDRAIVTSRTVTTTPGAASPTIEDEVETGIVSTGISLTIMPKIAGERIFLQASIQVSELVQLRQASGTANTPVTLPHVRRNQFFQGARLVSGETLALGGLVTRRGSETGSHLPSVSMLGTSETQYSNVETVLLITPTLLDAPAPDEELFQ